MKTCVNCNKTMKESAVFCPGCGAKQPAAITPASPEPKKKKKTGLILVILLLLFLAVVGTGIFLWLNYQKTDFTLAVNEPETTIAEESGNPDGESADSGEGIDEEIALETSDPAAKRSKTTSLTLLSGGIDTSSLKKAFIQSAVHAPGGNSEEIANDANVLAAFDGLDNTYWASSGSNNGVGEQITVYLDRQYEISALLFRLSDWNGSQNYLANNRPKTISITMGDTTQQVTFPEAMQEFCVSVEPAVTTDFIEFKIDDVYAVSTMTYSCITDIGIYGSDDGLGWQKAGDQWYFYEIIGTPKTGWLEWNGKRYFFLEDGTMKTGFLKLTETKTPRPGGNGMDIGYDIAGQGYFFLEDGSMYTGYLITNRENITNDAEKNQKHMTPLSSYFMAESESSLYINTQTEIGSDLIQTTYQLIADFGYYFSADGTYHTWWTISE